MGIKNVQCVEDIIKMAENLQHLIAKLKQEFRANDKQYYSPQIDPRTGMTYRHEAEHRYINYCLEQMMQYDNKTSC